MDNTSTIGGRSQMSEDIHRKGEELYDETREAVKGAYDKTSEALNDTYDRAIKYGRDNPGKLTLIAFGAGLGVGLLIANNIPRRSDRFYSSYAEPVVNSLSHMVSDYFRRR